MSVLRSPENKCQSNPDLYSSAESGPNVTMRKRKQPDCELTQAINSLSVELKKAILDLRTDMNNQFLNVNTCINNLRDDLNTLSATSSQIQSEVKELRAEYTRMEKDISDLKMQHTEMSQDVTDLKSSVNFNSDNYIDCVKRLKELESQSSNSTVTTIKLLEGKIDTLEQQARQCNIEIANMPEKRGENLMSILESIGSAVNMSISSGDIISIHRVPHAHAQNNRPKNIIVKFTTRIMRDNLLSAYRLSKGLTTDRIGLSGTSCRIYLNEHLTLRNKDLFRKCREAAKLKKFKFVWVRNATVLVKESEDSSTFAVRTEDEISSKIKSNFHPSDPNIVN
ncbi:hypothetical protein PYW08_007993 [Mythimna loreyi]|uniref:Uncharacterized protein n=1 Tax=Mythimna loreyi TaxID=667449 RepID=A0ACC2QF49_9NEOP|nr:hypothetical protein PYW08_007993 [Mythimna loreyi]